MLGHSTKRKISSAPGHEVLPQLVLGNSIPVGGQRSRNWSDSKGQAAKNSTCENEAEGAQRRPSSERTLFPDQFSGLDNEIIICMERNTEKIKLNRIARKRHENTSYTHNKNGKSMLSFPLISIILYARHIPIQTLHDNAVKKCHVDGAQRAWATCEFTTDRQALTSVSVTFCCIVCYPISVTSRLWMFNISQWKRLCQAFSCNSSLPLPSC